MTSPKFALKFFMPLVLALLALMLTGCADKWINSYNPAIDMFNKAIARLNKQLDLVSIDNSQVSNATWKADTRAALAALKNSAQSLRTLPAPEDSTLKEVDVLVKQLGTESLAAVDGYNAVINAEDVSLMSAPNTHMDEINKILPQINVLIEKYNK
jgi:hypothetical protein